MSTDLSRRRALAGLAASAALPASLVSAPALAQAWPSKPIRMVVPTPPGSSVDVAARLVAERLREKLGGATVLVENKPGAGGTIAAADVARSAPDGHSLFVGFNGPLATAEHVFPKLPYKPLEAFAPVIATVSQPHVLVVNANDPAKTLGEFVARVKAAPGKANYASVGNASASHLTMELFKSAAGLYIVHIPYNGGPAATQGLIAGDVDALFTAYVNVQGPVAAGRLRVLALAEKQRSPRIPQVPTFAELGLPQVDAPLWNAIVAPAGTPADIVGRLNQAIDTVLAEPAIRDKLAGGGMEVIGGKPEVLARMMRDESAKWLPVTRRLGIKPD
ncbi:tripartite tricarboxylate transporter substrate binding protein [Burkholderiaceae bacterium FT117]|uniref:Bug family tripartite tricarboxylate transporter substrate binding protein n=1 Tax=Zeimonas sediminis TaxID=2944268 RepID=UPI002342D3EA|nr:tripartite tricarboxylate transporter substrate binding protein [Zeimonas sediminis]MCM5570204.1 tripartite tricarboxylate transporter substrate binding protein [Zeimonas sediminis]